MQRRPLTARASLALAASRVGVLAGVSAAQAHAFPARAESARRGEAVKITGFKVQDRGLRLSPFLAPKSMPATRE